MMETLADLNVMKYVLENFIISHPNLCELLQKFLPVSQSMRLLKRSFCKLTKICYKDRNQLKFENLETLRFLSVLKEQCRFAIRKYVLLWNKHEYQCSAK